MLAVVKTPHTEFRVEGEDIPQELLDYIDGKYGGVEIIKDDDDELVDVFETDWYKKISAEMTSGDRLHTRRFNAGLTQAELGEKTGFSRQRISDMERGRRPISLAAAQKLAAALGVPVRKILKID
jgi:DNA-binding XRE family transcriptional regulator